MIVMVSLFSVLLDFLGLLVQSDREKALEILLLRQQIRILQRTNSRPPRLSWWEKVPLAILATKLVQGAKNSRARLSQSLLLFSPDMVLRWHRDLVRHKWTYRHRPSAGRPRMAGGTRSTDCAFGERKPALGI
jgi:putative transposase